MFENCCFGLCSGGTVGREGQSWVQGLVVFTSGESSPSRDSQQNRNRNPNRNAEAEDEAAMEGASSRGRRTCRAGGFVPATC